MKVDLGKVEVRAELRQEGRQRECLHRCARQVSQVHTAAQVSQVNYSQVQSAQCCTGEPGRQVSSTLCCN